MNKNVLISIAAGVVNGLFFLGYFTGKPHAVIFTVISTLPLFLVALMRGIGGTAIAAVAGMVTVAIIHGGIWTSMVGVSFYGALPACVVGYTALRRQVTPGQQSTVWYPTGFVISWLAVTFALLFVAWAALEAIGGVRDAAIGATNGWLSTISSPMSDQDRHDFARKLAEIAPGILAYLWMIGSLAMAGTAQRVLVRLKRNVRPTRSLATISLPHWAQWLFGGAIVLRLIGSGDLEYMGNQLALIFSTPFFFLGLAVVHMGSRKVRNSRLALAVFYVAIAMMASTLGLVAGLALAGLGIVGLGLVEQLVGLRSRFTDQEDWEF
jgi:hypothetical protein